MITRKPRQFLAVWDDDGISVKGATFEESFFVDGVFWKNELTEVASEGFELFGELFSNQLQIQFNEQSQRILELEQRVESLLESIPFDPRIIDATAFYNRLTKDELLVFVGSSNPQVVAIGKVIADYKANDWPVIFESQDFQNMVNFLQQTGVLSEARLTELTKDATRDEAYSAG
jgi:hypothetical protein